MKITNVTIAFAQDLFEPKAGEDGGTPKYKSAFLLKADDAQILAINKAISDCADAKWGAKGPATLKMLRGSGKVCLGDGDTKPYNGYAGCFYINAANPLRPTVVDVDKTPLTQKDGKPYSGSKVHAVIEFWAQDNKFGKRINATLMGVQFVADGERFGAGGVADESDFDDISAGVEAEDLA